MSSLITRDGPTLRYRTEGRGSLLICHPGGPGVSSWSFGDLAGLSRHLTLVMLNPRGTGGSDPPGDPRHYRIEDYVADLEELRAHLAVDRMAVLGHSHGGMVAMAYAATYPERVSRLILASTVARYNTVQRETSDRMMQAKAGEPWYADARAAFDTEESGDFSDEEAAELLFRKFPFFFARYGEAEAKFLSEWRRLERPNLDARRLFFQEGFPTLDLRPVLPRITAPTLVITGEADFRTGPVCAAEIAAGIPRAQVVLLPDTGHVIFVEARDRFREEVLSFLNAT